MLNPPNEEGFSAHELHSSLFLLVARNANQSDLGNGQTLLPNDVRTLSRRSCGFIALSESVHRTGRFNANSR